MCPRQLYAAPRILSPLLEKTILRIHRLVPAGRQLPSRLMLIRLFQQAPRSSMCAGCAQRSESLARAPLAVSSSVSSRNAV
jgi:hypothetical protein